MKKATIGADKYPTLYGYYCGYGRIEGAYSLFMNESKTCFDLKGPFIWEQFFFDACSPTKAKQKAIQRFKQLLRIEARKKNDKR